MLDILSLLARRHYARGPKRTYPGRAGQQELASLRGYFHPGTRQLDFGSFGQGPSTRVITGGDPSEIHPCRIDGITRISGGLLLRGVCAVGSLEQRILLTSKPDVLAVAVPYL